MGKGTVKLEIGTRIYYGGDTGEVGVGSQKGFASWSKNRN